MNTRKWDPCAKWGFAYNVCHFLISNWGRKREKEKESTTYWVQMRLQEFKHKILFLVLTKAMQLQWSKKKNAKIAFPGSFTWWMKDWHHQTVILIQGPSVFFSTFFVLNTIHKSPHHNCLNIDHNNVFSSRMQSDWLI